jgi:hypothetical protein
MIPQKTQRFPLMMIRLWPRHHTCKADLIELVAALKRNRGACDEVWFCTEFGFPPLEGHAHSARLMAEAAQEIRSLGIETGLQIANTLGHSMNLLEDNDGAQWPFLTGPDGNTSQTSPCPRAPEALEYIDRLCRLYAAWQPSSVWIDDDLRMTNHGSLKHGCFCPRCVREFSDWHGKSFDRISLVEALNDPSGGMVRLAWTRFNGESLANIAGVVAEAVHAVAPECRMGLQQTVIGRNLYSGGDFNPILERMASVTGFPARARVGGGYYTDRVPLQTIEKACYIGRQVSRFSPCGDQICAEIESYPHNAFGKSTHTLAIESSLDLALGCNSLSFAVLCSGHEPMSWYEPILGKLSACRPFWEEYVRLNAGTMPGGLEVRLGMEQVGRPVKSGEPPFAWGGVELYREYFLSCLGLPLCMSERSASGCLLPADCVAGLADDELLKLLKGGLMLDGRAAMQVQDRGMGHLLGVRLSALGHPAPYRERISPDPLNGIYAGRNWNSGTNPSGIFMLEALSPTATVLGSYVDRFGASHGSATVLFENTEGGRVAVFGYYGWEDAPSGAKRNQYLAAADWIARGRLPVVVQTTAQVMVVPRVNQKGDLLSVILLNASFDSTPPMKLRLRGVSCQSARLLVPENDDRALALVDDGTDKLCTTPPLPPWSVACIAMS